MRPALEQRKPAARQRTVGAIVVGGDYQGLGIAQSLAPTGIPVVVVDDERSIARFSRHVDRYVRVDDLRDGDRTVAILLEVGRRYGLDGWVLYPTREETVVAIARNRGELARVFRVPTPPWEVTRWAWDKRNTYRLAEQLGIPVPRTWYPASVDDLDRIDGPPPFVLKPAIKEEFLHATKDKAWRADDSRELRCRYEQASALVGPGEIMVQELVPGDGRDQYAYCAFFKDGRAVGSMVARRTRQHPPTFGKASTFAQTLELPEIEAPSTAFLSRIGYYGLAELEYKWDAREDRYKLLDVNARTWGYHTLGRRAGVDFPSLLHADQVGKPVTPARARPGVAWVRLLTDLPTAALEVRRGALDARDYLGSLRSARQEAVWSLRDPLPFLAEAVMAPYLYARRGF